MGDQLAAAAYPRPCESRSRPLRPARPGTWGLRQREVVLEGCAVIGDSIPWKEDLLRIATSLERRTTQRRWTERTYFLVERDVMNAGYVVRKLGEARKISDELAAERIPARRHALLGRPVDIWSRHEFYEHYDMEHPQTVHLTLTEFCNQVIHSWVWMLSATEEPPHLFDGIYVSSDWGRKRSVYFVAADTLIALFRAIGHDDVVYSQMQRDSAGDMQIIKTSRNHPPSDRE
jgi:hypothetical protein